jgi:hypothetical protein
MNNAAASNRVHTLAAVHWFQSYVVNRLFVRTPTNRRRMRLCESEWVMFRSNRPWTPDDDNRLRTLLENGALKTLVAAKLRRSVAAIEERASIIGISFRQIKLGLKAKGR